MDVNPSDEMIVIGCSDGRVLVWDGNSHAVPTLDNAHSTCVRAVGISGDSRLVLSRSIRGDTRVWKRGH